MSKHHGYEEELLAPYKEGSYEDTKASIEFLESIIEDQALQIEALQLRIKELVRNS